MHTSAYFCVLKEVR